MARNDVVILDSLIEKTKLILTKASDEAELFELFVFDQVLKDYDLSYEELETGWTDGGNDGGIDGFYVLIDGRIATDDVLTYAAKKNPQIDVFIFTVKRGTTFQLQPIDAIFSTLSELLDLTKEENELTYPYNSDILEQRALFLRVITALADRQPKLSVSINYCSRGQTENFPENLKQRGIATEELVNGLFSDTATSFNFIGSSELLKLARKQLTYTLRLAFSEPPITREGKDYLLLSTLESYKKFITDESGNLRRYLFDSNVRDYLGEVQINNDITQTLRRDSDQSSEDFWWLNNGVTILATNAYVVGKELCIENVQIVNGLQTTETVFRHFTSDAKNDSPDNRAILVKIIQTSDDNTRSRIIKATNYQNSVDLASLRGLDKIQRDIEDFLAKHGWFYDRRKNFYKNQGKPVERIVTVPYLAAAVRAIALGDPARSQKQRSKSLREDSTYQQIFDNKWDIEVFLASLEITKAVESVVHKRNSVLDSLPIALAHYLGYIFTCEALGKIHYHPNEVGKLVGSPPTFAQIENLKKELSLASSKRNDTGRKIWELFSIKICLKALLKKELIQANRPLHLTSLFVRAFGAHKQTCR